MPPLFFNEQEFLDVEAKRKAEEWAWEWAWEYARKEAFGKKLDGKPWEELSDEQKHRRIKKSMTDQMHGFTEFVDLLKKEQAAIAAAASNEDDDDDPYRGPEARAGAAMGLLKLVAATVLILPFAALAALHISLGPHYSAAFLAALVLLVVGISSYVTRSHLDQLSLAADLASLRRAFGQEFDKELEKQFTFERVRTYYYHTTDRDYKLLRLFCGEGQHTRLEMPSPIGHQGGCTRQPMLVYAEARAIDAKRVLEAGCGRGHGSIVLAATMPEASFVGVDLVARQIEAAAGAAASANLTNASFHVADATKLVASDFATPGSFDLIFGIEALCHMDSDATASSFMAQATALLRVGGRLVIVDGFRSATFETCPPDQRVAMMLAESGFRIRAMPSKQLWKRLADSHGLVLVRDTDLSHEALPFWVLGWRVARVVLLFPALVRLVVHLSAACRETAANLMSVSTTAHAMRERGAAEYGVLVFERR